MAEEVLSVHEKLRLVAGGVEEDLAALREDDQRVTAGIVGELVASRLIDDSEIYVSATNAAMMARTIGRGVFATERAVQKAGDVAAARFEAFRGRAIYR